MMKKVASRLKKALEGRVVIVGIGNKLRSDDGFGPVTIERLKDKTRAFLLDAGTAPESFLGPIIKNRPDTVIILDIADLGIPPGGIDILNKDDILKVGFSTHDASPGMFIDFLENNIDADIFMIAVQPKTVQFGGDLSREVIEAIGKLEKIF